MNELFSNQLSALETIMTKRGEPFRAKAYKKAQETIALWPTKITSTSQLKGAPNVGATIMEKLNEYVNTGKIQLIEEEKLNPIIFLTDVYGIGPKKATELVNVHGIKSIEQLRERQDLLNDVQRVGLKYYEAILRRIPRQEIEDYKTVFQSASTVANATFEIVGSYRRGATDSGDIDAIITTSNASVGDVFAKFVDYLIGKKTILEVLSRGPCKCLVIMQIEQGECPRRVDFLFSPTTEYAFAVLYFTGSKLFNTMMRQQAVNMGYSLNEHCISLLTDGVKTPVSSLFPTEQSIFDFFKMEYVEPCKRIGSISGAQSSTVVAQLPIKHTTKKRTTAVKEPSKKLVISDEPVINTMQMINEFRKHGISSLANYDEPHLKKLLSDANNAYHNNMPIVSDNEFDIIEQFVVNLYGATGLQVGAPVANGSKATLPYEMASMDKIKPDTSALSEWKHKYKGPYMLSSKLDGVSGLYCTEQGKVRLYTRGDGKVGQDVSHLIPFLRLPKMMNICIRGEFIIEKTVFNEKYKTLFANPRNMVAGLINHKHTDTAFYEKLKDVNFIAYEVISPSLKPSDQFEYLKSIDVGYCYNCLINSSALSNEALSELLVEMRASYVFETDGVIVCNDDIYARPVGNPEYAFAFKMVLSEQMAHAKVVSVLWTASKDGYLKPRVQIEPIFLGGVKIEFATGFNASFIVQNKIGVGAVVEIIRSGDVIPHIKRVIVGSTPLLPDCEYTWNDTNVDIIVSDLSNNETVIEKTVTLFFKEIGVDGLGPGNVKKICKAGFNSITKIVHMTKKEMSEVDGLGAKSADKICDSIDNCMKNASIVTLMSASNLFGRGFAERKIAPIMELYPNILNSVETKEEKVKKVLQVKGIAEKSAEAFVEGISDFNLFFYEVKGLNAQASAPVPQALAPSTYNALHPLFKKTVVLTGFRDKDLLQKLKDVGAIQGTSVSKNTFAVIVKQPVILSSAKIEEANNVGVPIVFLDDFVKKYFSV